MQIWKWLTCYNYAFAGFRFFFLPSLKIVEVKKDLKWKMHNLMLRVLVPLLAEG